MAVNKIELKRSAVPGRVPTTSSIDLGELAINTYDGKVFFKQSGSLTRIVELASTSGSISSASFAVSSSYAATSSYSDSLKNVTIGHIPYLSASQVLADSAMFQVDNGLDQGYSIAINQNGVSTAAPEALYVFQASTSSFNVISGKGNLDNYLQLNIQNLNAGTSASSDVVATANNGSETDKFIDMGINGGNYIDNGNGIGSANDAYLYSTGQKLNIGNASANQPLNLFVGGTNVEANKKLQLNSNNQHSMTGSLSVSGSLVASNNITASNNSVTNNLDVTNTITARTLVVQTVSSSIIYSSGSNTFGNNANNNQIFTGSVLIKGAITVSGSVINTLTSSYAVSASRAISSSFATSASQAITASYVLASGVVGLNLSQIASGSATASIDPNTGLYVNVNTSISGALNVSQSINAYNINVGTPTSNQWQNSLNGSYFNNFTSQTDVSEILRFVAGLLSASAPDAAPNTKTYSTYTANAQNTTTGTVIAGSVPQSSTNTTVTYLTSKGFASTGGTLFSGISPIYTQGNYGYTYTSVAAGTTVVSSSADAQLFGLGLLSSGTPTNFRVSGSFTFRFKDNSSKVDTATSSSNQLITQTGAGTTNGVSLAKINTSNPAVIPAAYQDGKYASVFSNTIYSGSAAAVSQSGYYHISASIQIASGSSAYTTPIVSNAEIFFAPLTTISTNVPSQTPTTGSTTVTALTAVSRSLSGAPYLSGSTYNLSSSFTNLFNPLYFANAGIATLSTVSTGMTQTSGVTTVSTAGGTIQTAGAVFDSTGTTVRATSTVPFETDLIKLNGLYTFGSANITNIAQTSFTPTTFTVSIAGVNKAASTTTYSTSSNYHTAGTFGQPSTSGSLAYYTRTQGTDTGTNSGASNSEPFTGESNHIVLNDNILSFTGTAWNTSYGLYTLTGNDLQVKPGYLVKPGGTYGYWLTDPDATKTYKYYVRRFITNGTSKTSMTLNLGQTLVDWQATTNNSIGALILFKSSNSSIYTPARFYDPTKTTSNYVGDIAANTDGQNPFGSTISLYGNTGGSLASTTYTMPIRNADGMFLNATYTDIYVIVRYKGDPTPVSSITVTFS